MSVYSVNIDGVEALKKIAVQVNGACESLSNLVSRLKSLAGNNPEGLGPHNSELRSVIEEISSTITGSKTPATEVSEKLQSLASKYQEIIENDPFSGNEIGLIGTFESNATSTTSNSMSTNSNTQSVHKEYIENYQQQVSAVIEDVKNGSEKEITEEKAKKMLYAIQSFSGNGSKRIRSAYNNPNAYSKDLENMQAVDDYIKSAPKWNGTVYRGINVSKETANDILSKDSIDMLGPSSWSSDKSVAERFSKGYKDVSIVFKLNDNKSGASITHIGSWNGIESEVTAPSGINYHIDNVEEKTVNGIDTFFVDVHE